MSVYLVTQATGQQSQWVIKHLLGAGHKIHVVVRNIEKMPALLSDPNITLFQGESKNLHDIFGAAQGCEAAFLNTVSFPGLEGGPSGQNNCRSLRKGWRQEPHRRYGHLCGPKRNMGQQRCQGCSSSP
ncbi:nitrogen metabolite repression protein nmrA [Fusarium bulbicola]|nr:nitrogen metabolite repression protein nmrA [Fusarium bulbicola]